MTATAAPSTSATPSPEHGSDALSAEYLRYTYRHGRVVYTVKVDASLASDEAGFITGAEFVVDGGYTAG